MSIKNDRWSALSLKDRADLMNMYITNGISDLKEMKKHYNGIPYRDLNTSDYDYFNASPEMAPTKEGQHWDSRNPHTGRLLKGESHPTFDLMVDGENKAGYKIVRGYNGELYSILNTPDNYVENYNSFGDGGDKRTKIESNPSVENFIKDWYFNPTTLQIMTSIENDMYNQGIDIRSSDVEKKLNVRKALNTPEYITSLEDDKLGHHVYNSDGTSYIEYNDAYLWGSDNPSPFVRIHEIDHDIQKRMPAQTLLTTQPVEYKLNKGFKEDSYLDRPDEIRSRIMELRKFFKLNPSKRDYTPKEAAKFQEILQENELNVASGIERLSPETLAGFLNYLAYNDSNKNQEVKVAKYGGRILDGNEEEQTLSGNTIDTSKRLESREEYLNKQRETIRLQALQNSLNRTEPSNPIMGKNNLSEEEWEQDKLARLDYMVTLMLSAKNDDEANFYKAGIEGIQKEVYNPITYGDNCIYTTLDNYGKKYKVAGNDSFLANPEKYGFKEIKTSDIKPGDLVQKYNPGGAHHMMMFDSYDTNGLPLYNYSSSYTKDNRDIKKKAHYKYEDINNVNNNYRAFTFIGNVEDNTNWNNFYNQYRKDYSSKVLEELKDVPKLPTDKARILDGTEDEQTTTGLPVGAGLVTYNHPKYNHAEEAEIYSYLRSRSVPHVQASAIMGNIAVESMLNPEITQIGGGGGYGLIQATDRSRKKAFINYDGQPYEFGSNISPETQRQLDYIIDKGLNSQTKGEWRGNHNIGRASVARRKFLEATDVNKASKIFTENYLRPGKPHTKRRKSMSNYFNDNYGITERALKEFENSFLFQNN